MLRDRGFTRARWATAGLAVFSLAGVVAVAGIAHADTSAQRSARMPPAAPSPSAPAGSHNAPKPAPHSTRHATPTPQPTKARHHATSGGS